MPSVDGCNLKTLTIATIGLPSKTSNLRLSPSIYGSAHLGKILATPTITISELLY
ncbi:hypothetical protein PGT21_020534 [Puccinia graminis f. sp. tritici]|uniref:Uncharacterized protein n=1 Tax=Puccinia graminis f. sp. tritici TaxID=56615 RepID=A0A5B0NN57_PUCGR|nr:hypothetical protein PGT21_020534 [Puccinia graminis f. sp. tritici]